MNQASQQRIERAKTVAAVYGFKGFGPVVEGFALKPERFVERLGKSLQSEALQGIQGLAALHEETLGLVETHLPDVDTSGEREMLRQIS